MFIRVTSLVWWLFLLLPAGVAFCHASAARRTGRLSLDYKRCTTGCSGMRGWLAAPRVVVPAEVHEDSA